MINKFRIYRIMFLDKVRYYFLNLNNVDFFMKNKLECVFQDFNKNFRKKIKDIIYLSRGINFEGLVLESMIMVNLDFCFN